VEDSEGPGVGGGGVESSAAGELELEAEDRDGSYLLPYRAWVTMGGVGSGMRRGPR